MLDTTQNFEIQMHRQYPQLFQASQTLAQSFSEDRGCIRLRASFQDKETGESQIPESTASRLQSLLEQYTSWNSISDLELILHHHFDPEVECVHEDRPDAGPARVGGNGKIHAPTEYPRPGEVLRTSLTYGSTWSSERPIVTEALEYVGDGPSYDWPLRGRYTVIEALPAERTVSRPNLDTTHAVVVAQEFCELRLEKTFCVRSQSTPSCSFCICVSQWWKDKSLNEIQRSIQLHNKKPQFGFHCEILGIDRPHLMTHRQRMTLFSSLLLKLQDFLDYPVCAAMHGLEPQVALAPCWVFRPLGRPGATSTASSKADALRLLRTVIPLPGRQDNKN